ncbi:MAG: hypothetical protein IT373_28515 [Polyangiaceae bacterium]|nr:hypothetical protein [Polyangiaceae bacterium]
MLTQATIDRLGDPAGYVAVPPAEVKGKDEPIRTYYPASLAPSARPDREGQWPAI